MKLNLGCGFRKKEGFVNVDLGDFCTPDVICDLARETWPWPESSVEFVQFEFSMEQMGESQADLKHVIKELYRVSKKEARVKIICLYPRHDQFFLNPLNSHRLSMEYFRMLSMKDNLSQIGQGQSDNCLALQYGVNFGMESFRSLLSADIHQLMIENKITEDEVRRKMRFENNICQALEIDLVVIKSNQE